MPPKKLPKGTKRLSAARDKKFAKALQGRLVLRDTAKYGSVYHLDFRAAPYTALGRAKQMLRNPLTVGWPDAGAPTSNEDEAKEWIDKRYAALIAQELDDARARAKALETSGLLSVAKGCDGYLDDMLETPGHSKATYRNRRAYINKTIKPALGHLPLAALTDDYVDPVLDKMVVTVVNDDGVRVTQPASVNTKRAIRAILAAVWKFALPGVALPFTGPELGRGDKELAQRFREQIMNGGLKELVALIFRDDLPRNLRRMLVGALWYDRVMIQGRRNMRRRSVANTAAALACFVSQGFRLEELTLLQWFCVREDRGIIIIPGTKSASGLRAMPLQEQFRPWLALLRDLARPEGAPADWMPDPDDFVFLTKPGEPQQRGSTRSISNRISEAIRWAGLKKRGEATHFGRKILASMIAPKIPEAQLKQYLGHADAYKGATGDYVLPMLDAIPPEHQQLVHYLPAPAELLAEVDAFEPAERKDIAQRKQRAAEAKARKAKEAEQGESPDSTRRELDVA